MSELGLPSLPNEILENLLDRMCYNDLHALSLCSKQFNAFVSANSERVARIVITHYESDRVLFHSLWKRYPLGVIVSIIKEIKVKHHALHECLRYPRKDERENIALIEAILEKDPAQISHIIFTGSTVLETALKYSCSLAVVKKLVQVKPTLLTKTDMYHDSMLHYAVEERQPFEIIEFIFDGVPANIVKKNFNRKTPVDLARDDDSYHRFVSGLEVIYRNL